MSAVSHVPRLDISTLPGWRGAFFRARWRFSANEKRLAKLQSIVLDWRRWEEEELGSTLSAMRDLVDSFTHGPIKHASALATGAAINRDQRLGGEMASMAMGTLGELPWEALHLIMELGPDLSHRSRNAYNDTLLTAAIRRLGASAQNKKKVEMLIQASPKPVLEMVDSCSHSPLRLLVSLASSEGVYEKDLLDLAQSLLRAGAHVDAANSYIPYSSTTPITALTQAALAEWVPGVDLLLSSGAMPGTAKENPLHCMIESVSMVASASQLARVCHIATKLVDHGADINGLDGHGYTPLYLALDMCRPLPIVSKILDLGGSVEMRDTELSLPVPHLLTKGYAPSDPALDRLVDKLPKDLWSWKDPEGRTALDALIEQRSQGCAVETLDEWISYLEKDHLDRRCPVPSVRTSHTPRL